ncbi:TPA: hypothetical protein ACH3X1_016379 [Trebouxia sp. C0004]
MSNTVGLHCISPPYTSNDVRYNDRPSQQYVAVEQDLTDEELVAFVNEDPADSDSDSDVEEEFAEEIIKAPSLHDAQGLGSVFG